MQLPPHVLDLDLVLQHDGHEVSVKGTDGQFVARFPTLLSLLHFSTALWPVRKHIPAGMGLHVELHGLRLRVSKFFQN